MCFFNIGEIIGRMLMNIDLNIELTYVLAVARGFEKKLIKCILFN